MDDFSRGFLGYCWITATSFIAMEVSGKCGVCDVRLKNDDFVISDSLGVPRNN